MVFPWSLIMSRGKYIVHQVYTAMSFGNQTLLDSSVWAILYEGKRGIDITWNMPGVTENLYEWTISSKVFPTNGPRDGPKRDREGTQVQYTSKRERLSDCKSNQRLCFFFFLWVVRESRRGIKQERERERETPSEPNTFQPCSRDSPSCSRNTHYTY